MRPPLWMYAGHFLSFWEGLSLRHPGGDVYLYTGSNFLSFWEGLSLRPKWGLLNRPAPSHFPSFWEGLSLRRDPPGTYDGDRSEFPFLLGRAFIEAVRIRWRRWMASHFPSFWEGLSLRHPKPTR